MAEPRYNALYPRQSDALVENWAAGTRPETLSAYQEPWYRALPNYLTGLVHGPDSTMAQANSMRHLAGTDNPLNLPGQFSEGLDTAAQGYKLGDGRMTGLGVLAAAGAIPFPGAKGAGQAAKLAAAEREIAAKAGVGTNALLPHPQPGGPVSGQQGHMLGAGQSGLASRSDLMGGRSSGSFDDLVVDGAASPVPKPELAANGRERDVHTVTKFLSTPEVGDNATLISRMVETGQVPDGWFVHGRANANALRDDAVIQATRNLEIADQYAGKKGSGWLLQPGEGARVADLYEGSPDLRKVSQMIMADYRKGVLPPDIAQAVEKPTVDEFRRVASGFAPEKIVNGAGAFDNPDWSQWLHDRAKYDFVRTPDGAVVLNPEKLNALQYFSRHPDAQLPPTPQGIRAYHGSPHDFDKFDINKIGTGEGAQAYGHGLYFAENEGVAKFYRDQLAPELRKIKDTADPYSALPDAEAISKLELAARQAELNGRKSEAKDYKDASDWIKSGRSSDFSAGRMYEVNIKADPEHFLDWDKPLSQQSEKVRNALQSVPTLEGLKGPAAKTADALRNGVPYDGADGASVLAAIGGNRDAGSASKALREAGIPGIRYLDQGSRSLGDGSRNYVVFDAATIEILRKYGLLPPMLAAGAAGAGSNALYDGTNNQ